MNIIIDRFEGEAAVVEMEDGKIVSIPRILIPKEAKEGDVLGIYINRNETENRSRKIKNLMDELFE